MYRIIIRKTAETIGYVEEPRYIYLASSGSYVQCEEQIAQGIAHRSTPYNLYGREPLSAEIDTVILREIDGGELIERQSKELDMLETALDNSDDVVISLYEHMLAQENFNDNIDKILMDLYEKGDLK